MAKYMPATSRPGRRSSAESWLECVRVVQAGARRQGGCAPFWGMLFIHSHLSFFAQHCARELWCKTLFFARHPREFFSNSLFWIGGNSQSGRPLGKSREKRQACVPLGSRQCASPWPPHLSSLDTSNGPDSMAGALHPTHQVCCNATCGVCGGRG